ncbi:MAG: O-antigen ligase family protein [Candidatus Moranbacteria bacterium]|nr:O-antigen ligase family protein [Candidatus Moranbacteria bacterium]
MKKFVEFGIYGLIFLLPWQIRWIFKVGKINGGASEYLTYSLYGVDILLIGLLILALVYFRKSIFTGKFLTSINRYMEVKLLLFFLFLGLLSIFWAENKTLALFREGQLILALSFFWLCANFAKTSKLAFAFLFSLIIPAVLGLWQFFFQTTFANKWFGLAEHKANLGGTSVIETFSNGIIDGRWLRAYGSFDHPNIFGATLAIGLLTTLVLFLKLKKSGEKIPYLSFFYFSFVILSAGIFVSFSRSAWLGFAIGAFFVAICLFFQKNFVDLKNWIFGCLLIVVVFSVMLSGYHDLVGVRIGGSTRLESLSLDQRAIYLGQAETMISKNSILGVGIGNYIPTLLKSNPNNQVWTYQPVHNVFLLAWAELGIFGMLSLVALLGSLFWRFGRKSPISGALLIAILPMLWLDHWLWNFHFGIIFFALIFALVAGFSREEKV